MDITNKIHQAIPPTKTGKRMVNLGGGSRVKADSALTASEGYIIIYMYLYRYDFNTGLPGNIVLIIVMIST